MIGNDTYPLTLDSGYLHGAAIALTMYRPTRPVRQMKRLDTSSPGYRLAATVTDLRCAVTLAIACLRTGRVQEALDTLERV